MISKEYITAVEKTVNSIKSRRNKSGLKTALKIDVYSEKTTKDISSRIDSFINSNRGKKKKSTIYDDIISYLERLNSIIDSPFLRKNGAINESRFYNYAYIDKSTWSSLKNNQIVPSKKTILKLAIALRLNEDEAVALMEKANNGFDYNDTQDLVFLALINMKVYDIPTVIETLEYYQYNSNTYFDSVYDTAEEQLIKRREYEARKKAETKRKIRELMNES